MIGAVDYGSVGLYSKRTLSGRRTPPKKTDAGEVGAQGRAPQAYCQVAQNKACPAYVYRADVKASGLWKLETQ